MGSDPVTMGESNSSQTVDRDGAGDSRLGEFPALPILGVTKPVVTQPLPPPNHPLGYRIRHETLRSVVAVVPVPAKPFRAPATFCPSCRVSHYGLHCPTCNTIHTFKHVHLWLDAEGVALVSAGVFSELQMGGMPQLVLDGTVENPPSLVFGHGASREQVDAQNRRISYYHR